ncbi:hypothetical protein ACHAWF_006101 [Thalassiosira exigua]
MADPRHERDGFWPRGYALPEQLDAFVDDLAKDTGQQTDKKEWILKERSGYGGHGNTVASAEEVMLACGLDALADSVLCQRIVDPPMLLDGCKFSLRVYVISFPRGRRFWMTASVPLMRKREGMDYDKMWNDIEESIGAVMKRYVEFRRDNAPAYAPLCILPQILGFDFILDSATSPFLPEVNRFPGLEPRSSMGTRT